MSQKSAEQHKPGKVSQKDVWLTLPQKILPQHFLSKMMHNACRCRINWVKNLQINWVIKHYKVDMQQAIKSSSEDFVDFNAFFTRKLKPERRPLAQTALVSPVDGKISQIGDIMPKGRLLQAKGQTYTVTELLGGDAALAGQFDAGQFATIYLSPRDYHRIHMPHQGTLQNMRYIPGKLFSVNPLTVRGIPRVFARNERVVTLFETEFGPMAVILVGAIFVGSMQTVWHPTEITPPYGKTIEQWRYPDATIQLAKGAEMGRFNMGSTVIVLLPKQAPKFNLALTADDTVQMGQALS